MTAISQLIPRVFWYLIFTFLCILCAHSLTFAKSSVAIKAHALAMHGKPKYSKGFKHVDYVNPQAPKGGTLTLATIGSFDSFNPFIAKGLAASGLGFVFETLAVSTQDEPFTEYGLIAEKIETPADRSWVIFHLNKHAKFSDGKAITATDVVFSFNKLIQEAAPQYRFYYADVAKAQALSRRQVKFSFKAGNNKELPLIMGQLPVLAKHYWKDRSFQDTSFDIPVSSGPYRIQSFDPGKTIIYERNPNYWGKDLAINKGRHNFDTIVYKYYLDNTIALEAFKAGEYDFRRENNAKLWATQYTGKAFDENKVAKETLPHQLPAGMQAFAFNLRRPLLQDKTLRQAMAYAFDFEWSNKNLFYDQYTRTHSYFQNTPLAASKLPSPEELKLLEPIKDQVPPEVFTTVYTPPKTTGQGKSRQQLRQGLTLLKQAGYTIIDNTLHTPAGQPVKIEFLMRAEGGFERIILPFKKSLETMGIDLTLRKVDITQYVERLRTFDFDMAVHTFAQSLSPGNEQRDFWHSSAADTQDSKNVLGLKNPAVDYLVTQLIAAPDRQQLIYRTRALDRVLQWNHYVIPNWHISSYRLSYWKKLKRPSITPPYGIDLMSWWIDSKQ